jgi:hypothetical protein
VMKLEQQLLIHLIQWLKTQTTKALERAEAWEWIQMLKVLTISMDIQKILRSLRKRCLLKMMKMMSKEDF